MAHPRRYARVFLSGIAISALLLSITVASLAAPGARSGKISKDDRERLDAAIANGQSSVTMLFATIEAQTGNVASSLRALGATVRVTDGDAGYIRADVPTDRVDAAAKLPGVAGSELDQTFN